MEFFLAFVFWVFFAVLVGMFAASHGRTGFGWAMLSLLLSPLICAVILLVLPDLKAEEEQRQARARADVEKEQAEAARRDEAQRAAAASEAARQHEARRVSGADIAIKLDKLQQLRTRGILSDIEFGARKQQTISELKSKMLVESAEDFLGQLLPLIDNGTLTPDDVGVLKTIAFNTRVEALPSVVPAPPPAPSATTGPAMHAGRPYVPATRTNCPRCGNPVMPLATRCGHCWASFER